MKRVVKSHIQVFIKDTSPHMQSYDEWFSHEVQKGIDDINKGHFVSLDNIKKELEHCFESGNF